jgi:hypothetical protein
MRSHSARKAEFKRQIGGIPVCVRAEGREEFRHDRAAIGDPFGRDRAGEEAVPHRPRREFRHLLVAREAVVAEQPVAPAPRQQRERGDGRTARYAGSAPQLQPPLRRQPQRQPAQQQRAAPHQSARANPASLKKTVPDGAALEPAHLHAPGQRQPRAAIGRARLAISSQETRALAHALTAPSAARSARMKMPSISTSSGKWPLLLAKKALGTKPLPSR